MYDRVVAHIDAYVSAVADDVAGLRVCQAYTVADTAQRAGTMLKAYAKVLGYTHDKSRTVSSVGQTGAAVYIRVAYELGCEACNRVAGCASRAGANNICEISALAKPNLLIPLSAKASRGDQILNARSFEKQGFSMVLEEEELTGESLLSSIHQLYENRETYIAAMKASHQIDSISKILSLIQECERKG